MRSIVLLVHDIRSTHNVGAIFRTAECMGVKKLYITGYTPHPTRPHDDRLPHIVRKLTHDIEKTALGATTMIKWEYEEEANTVISRLRSEGYTIVGLEQAGNSTALQHFAPPNKVALVLGREVEGINPELLQLCDTVVEIPQFGRKESLNVVQATAIALYHLRSN